MSYDQPVRSCPYCGYTCEAGFVGIGVGMQQCGPYHCEDCLASEIGTYDSERPLTDEEKKTGWYRPASPPGSSANTDAKGRIIGYREADALYRASCGVAPRGSK